MLILWTHERITTVSKASSLIHYIKKNVFLRKCLKPSTSVRDSYLCINQTRGLVESEVFHLKSWKVVHLDGKSHNS